MRIEHTIIATLVIILLAGQAAIADTPSKVPRAIMLQPFAEVISEKIWQPIGAESDAVVMVATVGAFSTIINTLRDLGRFGLLFTLSWQKVSKKPLVSETYLKKIQKGGRPEIFDKAEAGLILKSVLARAMARSIKG